MKVFGVTGGVGMGKSACADLLKARGFSVVDTDELARQAVKPGEPALAEIEQLLGKEVIDDSGTLRRNIVAARVFADPIVRGQLEGILHPRIRALWKAQIQTWKEQGVSLAFVIIPLLFETKAEQELGGTICIACSAGTQRQRLLERGWTSEQIHDRIGAQFPIEVKLTRSHFVIWTEGSLDVHDAQLNRILGQIG